MTKGRASSDALDALHALAAEAQAEELRRNLKRAREPKTIMVGGKSVPNPDYQPLDTKLLAVAIKFLKDNGIDTAATSPRITGLVDELNRLNVDDDPAYLTN